MRMRAADATTLFRTLLIILVVYLILIKFSPFLTILIFVIATLLDGIDGYLAVWQESNGKITLSMYIRSFKDKKLKKTVKSYKENISKHAKVGPRMDIAGDRFAEYAMWIVFTYTGIIPIAILLAVVIRHNFADAFMGSKGTSSKMKSKFTRVVYTSNLSRAGINIAKIVTFSYLILMYVASYPAIWGYVLTGILFTFIMLRGIAEIYENIK